MKRGAEKQLSKDDNHDDEDEVRRLIQNPYPVCLKHIISIGSPNRFPSSQGLRAGKARVRPVIAGPRVSLHSSSLTVLVGYGVFPSEEALPLHL
jgi:hypothetical protein